MRHATAVCVLIVIGAGCAPSVRIEGPEGPVAPLSAADRVWVMTPAGRSRN